MATPRSGSLLALNLGIRSAVADLIKDLCPGYASATVEFKEFVRRVVKEVAGKSMTLKMGHLATAIVNHGEFAEWSDLTCAFILRLSRRYCAFSIILRLFVLVLCFY